MHPLRRGRRRRRDILHRLRPARRALRAGGCHLVRGRLPAAVPYAGFWVRFLAALIDGAVMSGLTFPLLFVLTVMARIIGVYTVQRQPAYLISGVILYVSLIMAGNWLYFAKMESSSWQATLGKKALGLQVTDLEEQRIGFGQATARYLGKFVSSLILGIGYIMAGFTQKKQALHDIMAGTLVVRRDS